MVLLTGFFICNCAFLLAVFTMHKNDQNHIFLY